MNSLRCLYPKVLSMHAAILSGSRNGVYGRGKSDVVWASARNVGVPMTHESTNTGASDGQTGG